MIDPRISLEAARGVPKVSQAISIYENALMNSTNRDLAKSQDARASTQAGLNNQLTQAKIDRAPLTNAIDQQSLETGDLRNQQAQLQLNEVRDNQRLKSIADFAITAIPQLEADIASGNMTNTQVALTNRLSALEAAKAGGQDVDSTETQEGLAMAKQNPQELLANLQGYVALAKQKGLYNSNLSSGQREFNDLVAAANLDDGSVLSEAAKVKLRIAPPASLTGEERIALDNDLGNKVAEQKGKSAKAAETEKLKANLKFKPQITKATKLAEKEATEKGEVLTDLARMKAAKPGLDVAVDQLRDLSTLATSTLGGKAFDFAVKQSGFGATKGATARAKFIAIIDNQVLPLLKPTFGAAFTVQEGESLKATMGDPDSSVEEKMAQLEAFISQKERDIETKERQASGSAQEIDDPLGIL